MSLTETLAKRLTSQPNTTYLQWFAIEKKVAWGKPFWVATRGNYVITKWDYKDVLKAIKKV